PAVGGPDRGVSPVVELVSAPSTRQLPPWEDWLRLSALEYSSEDSSRRCQLAEASGTRFLPKRVAVRGRRAAKPAAIVPAPRARLSRDRDRGLGKRLAHPQRRAPPAVVRRGVLSADRRSPRVRRGQRSVSHQCPLSSQ